MKRKDVSTVMYGPKGEECSNIIDDSDMPEILLINGKYYYSEFEMDRHFKDISEARSLCGKP